MEETEIRVLYDGTTLYVGILARDREPGRVLARILQRDKIMQPLGFDQSCQFAGDDPPPRRRGAASGPL